ncbi:MAG: hypothetical protein AB7T49_02395 [Oligoflexales bacterium]
MRELLEFHPESEDTVVSRILIAVHEAIDREFPKANPPPSRFAKTVFSGNDEPTALNQPGLGEFASVPDTSREQAPGTMERTKISGVQSVLFMYCLISLVTIIFTVLCFYLLAELVKNM